MALARIIPAKNNVPKVEMPSDYTFPSVRVTVVQASTIFFDTPATLDKADYLLAEAAGLGSQLVLFPEAFVGGYPRGLNFGVTIGNRTEKGKENFRKYHAAAIDVPGPEVDQLAAMARKYKVYLVMGVIERASNILYSTVLFFDSEGQYLGKHRKVMPTAREDIIWRFGDESSMPIFETPLGKIGAVISEENRMPCFRTTLYDKGIQIYCAPTTNFGDAWQATIRHIAVEGKCFVLCANQFCMRKHYPLPPAYNFLDIEEDLYPGSIVCPGGSMIISPFGSVLAGPNHERQAVISTDLDIGEIAREKLAFDVVRHWPRAPTINVPKPEEEPVVEAAASATDSEPRSSTSTSGASTTRLFTDKFWTSAVVAGAITAITVLELYFKSKQNRKAVQG